MSLANYVIICKSRTNVLAAKSVPEKIAAVSAGAADLMAHIDVMHPGELTDADSKPISDLQHLLMDHIDSLKEEEADGHIKEMVKLMYALEKKFK